MCGIAGFWGAPDAALLATMTARIAHRGPDGEGFFEHPLASLGHRRLAIIDPAGGHQPVGTDDGSVQLTYNGEVYNFRELRAELIARGHRFRSQCDSEVVVHGYEEWGDEIIQRAIGMFAFALWSSRERRLLLARDAMGMKPLYYWWANPATLVFASEVTAFLGLPGFTRAADRRSLRQFLELGFIYDLDRTSLEGVFERNAVPPLDDRR